MVAEYMRHEVVTLSAEATIEEAVGQMIRHKTNGLVAVDAEKKVVGILSSLDIISHIVPDYLEQDKHLASFEAENVFSERVKEVAHDPILKCMSEHVHTVKSTHSLIEAATLMSEHHIRQLPVVDDAGVLVGYVNRTDIKLAIGEVLGITE